MAERPISVTVYSCWFNNRGVCIFPGEKPSGVKWVIDGERNCGISAGDRSNLNACNVGGQEENVRSEDVQTFASDTGMIT